MEFNFTAKLDEMSPPTNDFGIVPDEAYNSPIHSPSSCHNYDIMYSPASSEANSVDSAFGELAEVIPEIESDFSSQDSPKIYNDLTDANSFAISYDYHESDSGYGFDDSGSVNLSLYDSAYTLSPGEYKPENKPLTGLLEEPARESAKRPASFWISDACDLSELPLSVINAKKMKLPASGALEEEPEDILASVKKASQASQQFSYQYQKVEEGYSPENSRVLFIDSDTPPSDEMQGSFLRDENNLIKGFEVLAQYLCSDTKLAASQKKSQKKPVIDPEENSSDTLYHSSRITEILQSKRISQQSVTAQMKEHATHEPAIMFSMSNTKASITEAKKVSLQKKSADKSTAEIIRNWKAPPRQKQSHLTLQPSKPRLYNFLLELLQDPVSYSCIEWVDQSQGIFRFLDSAKIASLWGHRKNKPNMKYENFARSLRTYIAKGILTKPRNKLVYQFTAKVF